ncbi:hypothetical protein [Lapillicoccus jejuensis]|uniref:Uncharacterized protein n=1 Tax=Lapillicoccus jejuensis TaxID=402171 RepID=A0A542E1M1_9MICO|nr:hypothetical protein [Lapillicoccus jejuensis]TQJ09233.1 hypothetical protein FB458_2343 [Lapillicoccus jejuensis]
MTTPPRPLPTGVAAELRRVTDRWRTLPVAEAGRRTATVRTLLDELAVATAPHAGPVPDLGPAALPDQLAVLVYDAAAAGEDPQRLEARLADLRRAL